MMTDNKIINFIISLIIAISLWCYVVYDINPPVKYTFKNVDIQLSGLDNLKNNGLMVGNNEKIKTDVTIEGRRSIVKQMHKKDISVLADVSECACGDNVVALDVQFKKNVALASDETMTAHIDIDKIIKTSKPIKLVYRNVPQGYKLNCTNITQKKLQIIGGSNDINQVSYIGAVCDFNNINNKRFCVATLISYDKEGKKVNGVNCETKNIKLKIKTIKSKQVPLKVDVIGNVKKGYVYNGFKHSDKVDIEGAESIIDDINYIKCKKINISSIKKDSTFYLKPIVSDRINILNKSSLKATVYVSRNNNNKNTKNNKKHNNKDSDKDYNKGNNNLKPGAKSPSDESAVKNFEVVLNNKNFQVLNLPDESEYVLNTKTVLVKVKTSEEIKSNDFIVKTNLKNVDVSYDKEISVPITVKYLKNGKLKDFDNKIEIIIKKI